uniref:Uncharacterized protein n=1 Tax=Candidatus Kentrum sp. MB TaxID=2138164 RepID=A0A450XSG9_9GAMM|nr:MAG: hypothetical protein BECKMB1821G_GA0114241_10401 [Candidatus Kentron sp. MB]VFK32212.1 MAG: hypothetical protein BECKMB1821I_GA0114274_10311 [Candidatus Kentron sp. MB]VFK75752.1 MAG: hypothetical protein BECKMB1821H_GA0114242_10311 [Candidatus Kentron sp. MB]
MLVRKVPKERREQRDRKNLGEKKEIKGTKAIPAAIRFSRSPGPIFLTVVGSGLLQRILQIN